MSVNVEQTSIYRTEAEIQAKANLRRLLAASPIPQAELPENLGLFTNRQSVTRMLFMHDLYKRILHVHGVAMEFGTRWGRDLALWSSFRGMYEPYNHTRRIIGFDTFEGFVAMSDDHDGPAGGADAGSYAVSADYNDFLEEVLAYHEAESPLSHMRKFEVVKGDASVTVPEYLASHPETIIALAYFDMDVYEPTKVCLEAIRPHLTKGSVIGFDELNYTDWPGETVAVQEVFGIPNLRIMRSPTASHPSFAVVE